MASVSALKLWLPLIAVAAHIFEEFVWPGGFAGWFRAYSPERAASVTTSFLVWINALLVTMALLPPALGRTARGLAFWLVVASIAAANGAFHVYATAKMRRYSPGVVTGTLLYLPLVVLGYRWFVVTGLVHPATAVQAFLIGPAYLLFSAWNHSRRAKERAGIG